MVEPNAIYSAIKMRIKTTYGDGERFSSKDMRDICEALRRPFNDITVRLKYLSDRKIIEECGRIKNARGGHPICQYRLINMNMLLQCMGEDKNSSVVQRIIEREESTRNQLNLHMIFNRIIRNRLECIND